MRSLSIILFCIHASIHAQSFTVAVTDDLGPSSSKLDQATIDLYAFLHMDRYVAHFKMPDRKAHDAVLVMRSASMDGPGTVDTLLDTPRFREVVVGGFPWDPEKDVVILGRSIDSTHYEFTVSFGIRVTRTITLPWPNPGYSLNEGITSGGKPVTLEMGKPAPFLVLTQPYPDPPPPAKPVLMRYCFGSDVPPDRWPSTFGVKQLFIFELTVLP